MEILWIIPAALIGGILGRMVWYPLPKHIRDWAYPFYDCMQCVGQEEWRGCYCSYNDAYGPCDPYGSWYNRVARWFVDRRRR